MDAQAPLHLLVGPVPERLAAIGTIVETLDSLHVAACLFDEADRALLWNRGFLRFFPEHDGQVTVGEPYAENLRRFYRGRLGPQEMGAIDQCIEEGLARHRAQTQPFIFQHRGRWLRVASQPLPGLGRIRIWTQIAAPSTPGDLMPEEVEDGDGRAVLAPDGRILSANSRFARLFGLVAPADAAGRTLAVLLHAAWAGKPGAADILGPALQTLAEGERFMGMPFELPLPEQHWLRVLQHRLYDARVITSFADISAMKRLQCELNEAREKAERANRAKDALLATVSHELRTPLNGVLGILTLLEVEKLPPEAARHLAVAHASALSLLRLVDDILAFSRREGGPPSTAAEPADPAQLVEEVVQLLRPQAAAKGLRLHRLVAADVPALVELDAARLRQVLVNLVGNAVKFTARGEVAVQLSCGGRAPDGRVMLSLVVSDTGIGIPAQALDRIFEPHVQADPGIAQRYGGSGLGLAICRTLVQAMGGEISVASTEGQGSWFTVLLPCREVPGQARPRPLARPLPKLPPLRVLVVDDQALNREVARVLLERLGLSVTLAGRDEEALAACAAPFDLLVLDLDMPGLGGIGLLHALREAAPAASRMRAIALTAHAGEEHRELCRGAGFDGFLTKPVTLEGLADAILEVTGRAAPEAGGEDMAAVLDRERIELLVSALPREGWDRLVAEFESAGLGALQELASPDAERRRLAAHGLKGVALNFGARQLGDMAARMERNAAENVAAQLPAMRQALERSVRLLRECGAAGRGKA